MPIKYLNRNNNSTTISAGNSVQFNGSNYLSVPTSSVFTLGTNNHTIEFWIYQTSRGTYDVSWDYGSSTLFASNTYYMNIGSAGCGLLLGNGSGGWGVNISKSLPTLNAWHHVAIVRNSNTFTLYIDGVGTSATYAANISAQALTMKIGSDYGTNRITGYISNFRFINGTAVYTGDFIPQTSPLTAIANTSLLTCNAATIVDASSNNFTITNNGSATVSATVPFTASISTPKGIKFKNRSNVGTSVILSNSVQFNGSNQYLKLPSNSSAWTLNGDFTIECWFNTSTTNQNGIFTMNWNGDWNTAYGNGFSLCTNYIITPQGNTNWTAPSINVWHHIAAVRSGATITIYLDGVNVGSQTNSNQFGNTSTTPGIGLFDTYSGTIRSPFPGYLSNLRLVKGTALYTSNFTPPTAPLTAIANTSLLTCNAAIIVDGSSNNFTITNNNSATVSSITPFTVATATSTMKLKKVFADPIVVYLTQKAIFGYGYIPSYSSITNLVSNTGVVATDTTGVGTARFGLAAAGYGTDKAIFGYGTAGTIVSITNLVSNTGVVATDTTGVGTVRNILAAAGYGTDKAIFGYGRDNTSTNVSMTNLVSNTGIVSTDTAGVGTARQLPAAAGYGTDKAIFGYGTTGTATAITNLVSNTGVVATDTTGVGTARYGLAAAGYGTDKAIFGYGYNISSGGYVSMTNLVSNTGVVATDTAGVGTARRYLAAAGYGNDKAIFGYGTTGTATAITNLVSNTGVVATDTTGVGTARTYLAAAGYSLT